MSEKVLIVTANGSNNINGYGVLNYGCLERNMQIIYIDFFVGLNLLFCWSNYSKNIPMIQITVKTFQWYT